jgi:RNA polymerase sigma-70 factor (ECF subfamily)
MAAPPPPSPALAGEAALLARLRAGDAAAFRALVARHGGPLLRLARTFVRTQAAAEDMVQDTWLAALDGLDGFEGRSSLRTWLFHVLVNRARTRAQRDGRSVPFSALGVAAEPDGAGPAVDPARFSPDGHWAEPIATWRVEDPERLALSAETGALLEAAIAALPEGQRAVLTLRDVEGLETDEICDLLGITVTNQRVLLHRARTAVRAALAAHLG